VIYASGNTEAAGGFPSALPLEDSSPDPDLWLIRDCLYDANGGPLTMFWQASSVGTSNQLPGLLIENVNNPISYNAHYTLDFPRSGTLATEPDHVTATVHLKAIGDDVLQSLVTSGDLDPSIPPLIASYTLAGGGTLDWTPTGVGVFSANDPVTNAVMTCVTTGTYKSNITAAVSHAKCPAVAPQ
jgi:hypothetical protein